MAAASATLQQKRVEVLIPPQAADWLKVMVFSSLAALSLVVLLVLRGPEGVDASFITCTALLHCFCPSRIFPQAVRQTPDSFDA